MLEAVRLLADSGSNGDDVKTRDKLIESAIPTIKYFARKFSAGGLPDGVTRADLESDGTIAACRAADSYDPTNGSPFLSYARHRVEGAMMDTLKRAGMGKRRATVLTLTPDTPDGSPKSPCLPRDPKQSDPSEIASMRESITLSQRRGHLDIALPTPSEVADQVTKLRSAMFGALDESAVAEMMQSVMRAAQSGDLKAAKIIIDMLAPARSGVTVQQQAIVVNQGDLT